MSHPRCALAIVLIFLTQPMTCSWGTSELTRTLTRCAQSLAFRNSFAKSASRVEKVVTKGRVLFPVPINLGIVWI
jgi:hypothetical protein